MSITESRPRSALAETAPAEIDGPLNAVERADLDMYEYVVERNREAFLETGNALMQIRDRRLYRETHHSFGDYLLERWQIGRSGGYELIDAAKVVQAITAAAPPDTTVAADTDSSAERIHTEHPTLLEADRSISVGKLTLPTNVAQTRELAKLPPEQIASVWHEVTNQAASQKKPVTAAKIRETARAAHPKCVDCGAPPKSDDRLTVGGRLCKNCYDARRGLSSNPPSSPSPAPAAPSKTEVRSEWNRGLNDEHGMKALQKSLEGCSERWEHLRGTPTFLASVVITSMLRELVETHDQLAQANRQLLEANLDRLNMRAEMSAIKFALSESAAPSAASADDRSTQPPEQADQRDQAAPYIHDVPTCPTCRQPKENGRCGCSATEELPGFRKGDIIATNYRSGPFVIDKASRSGLTCYHWRPDGRKEGEAYFNDLDKDGRAKGGGEVFVLTPEEARRLFDVRNSSPYDRDADSREWGRLYAENGITAPTAPALKDAWDRCMTAWTAVPAANPSVQVSTEDRPPCSHLPPKVGDWYEKPNGYTYQIVGFEGGTQVIIRGDLTGQEGICDLADVMTWKLLPSAVKTAKGRRHAP